MKNISFLNLRDYYFLYVWSANIYLEGGGDPITFTLLYRVADIWWRQLNLNNISYGIPSGPEEDSKFALFSIFLHPLDVRAHNWMVRNLEIPELWTKSLNWTSLNCSSLWYRVSCIFLDSSRLQILGQRLVSISPEVMIPWQLV